MIYKSVSELIGKTPLVELTKIEEGLNARILAKLEFFNPAGSVKDRVAKNMIEKAEKEGKLKPGSVIIEPTSGNTGIGIAAVAASKGYRAVIVMPETMSVERQRLMKAYGAELVLTEGVLGMQGAIAKAEELCRSIEGSIIAGQFTNPSNPEAHYLTTGPEIWEDTAGNIDFFVAGIGTGGTITGVGKYLKEKNPEIKIIGVEPSNSPFISKGEAGPHGLQGIGAGFKPEILDTDIIDEIITVSENEAYNAGRALARCEGILTGITSGASIFASLIIASRPGNEGKTVVALLPDTGERYLSCEMYR